MFVNRVPFLVTVTRAIKLITVECLETRTAKQLSACLQRISKLYLKGGFHIRTFYMDGEFEKIKSHMPEVDVNTTGANEHVGEVERCIRTIKERARGIINTLPFSTLPKHILIELLYHTVLWLNAFPTKNVISSCFSPREIITHVGLDFKKHCRVPFGTYCKVHEYPNPLNSTAPRTKPAIALGPTGNAQGTYKFFCLTNGTMLRQNNWTEYPMPDSVIKQVNKWGTKSMQPEGDFTFSDRHRTPYPWNQDVDNDLPLTDPESSSFPAMTAEMPGVDMEHNAPTPALEDTAETFDSEPTVEEQHAQAALATQNTDLDQLPTAIPAKPEEIEPEGDDMENEDEGIQIDKIPQAAPLHHAPIEVPEDTDGDDEVQEPDEAAPEPDGGANDDEDEDEDNEPIPEHNEDTDQEPEDNNSTGVRRSTRHTTGKRVSTPYHEEFAHMNVEEYVNMNLNLNTEKATNVREYTMTRSKTTSSTS
ncbi:hypothetical protein ACHAXS_003127 [Conticribra weissflogii]